MRRLVIYMMDDGKYGTSVIDTNYVRSRSEKYADGDKLVYTDHKGDAHYVIATGFYSCGGPDGNTIYYVRTATDEIIDEHMCRRPNEIEFDRFSRYPDTVALRTYLNWMYWDKANEKQEVDKPKRGRPKKDEIVSQGTDRHRGAPDLVYDAIGNVVEAPTPKKNVQGPGPHLHVDDFMSKYGGRVTFRMNSPERHHFVGDMNFGSYIDMNYSGGRNGFPIASFDDNYRRFYFDHPYKNKRPLCGSYLTGPFLLETPEFQFDELVRGRYDERDPVYVRLQEGSNRWIDVPTKLWDPVADVVRVERICGNDTFISEFGYICSIMMYTLITGEEYARWRLQAMDI